MFRYPKGYKPGIPTFSAQQEAQWLLYCELGALDRFPVVEVESDVLIARGRALGMDEHEIKWHLAGWA